MTETRKVYYTREFAHQTFNGGHLDEPAHSAFHHGMDTVFNLIDEGIAIGNTKPDEGSLLELTLRHMADLIISDSTAKRALLAGARAINALEARSVAETTTPK